MTSIYSASAALPYPHRQGAVAGLCAELRHLVELGCVLGRRTPEQIPDWDTLVVTGPTESTDARGRVWFEYTATVSSRAPEDREVSGPVASPARDRPAP